MLAFIGLLIAGTSQVLRYNIAKKEISYASTVALFSGYEKSYTTEHLETIVYNLHKVTHQREKRFNEAFTPDVISDSRRTYHTTWDGVVTLWYDNNYNVELPKISHSESLENGLKEISEALGVKYERHEVAEKQNGII
jgi:hypothetical protein